MAARQFGAKASDGGVVRRQLPLDRQRPRGNSVSASGCRPVPASTDGKVVMTLRQSTPESGDAGIILGQLPNDLQGPAVLGLRLRRPARPRQQDAEIQMALRQGTADARGRRGRLPPASGERTRRAALGLGLRWPADGRQQEADAIDGVRQGDADVDPRRRRPPPAPPGRPAPAGRSRVPRRSVPFGPRARPAASGSPPVRPAPTGTTPPLPRAVTPTAARPPLPPRSCPSASSRLAISIRLRPTLDRQTGVGSRLGGQRLPRGQHLPVHRQGLLGSADARVQQRQLEIRGRQRPPRGNVILPGQQCTQLAVEVRRRSQQSVAQFLELALLQQEVLADAGVKRPDRLDGQIVPGFDGGLRPGQFGIRLGKGLFGGRLACERLGQLGLCQGLHRQHGRQPDHAGHQGHGPGRHRGTVPPRPSPSPPRQWLAPRRRPARRPSSDPGRRPAPWAWRSGPRARWPWPSGIRPPVPCRSSGSSWEGRWNCPARTACKTAPMSSPSNGGRPVNRQYSVAPRL